MEDVGKQRAIVGALFYFYLCGCCIIFSTSLAATQGTLGQTSTGFVSVSVYIPHNVRLLANPVQRSSTQTNYCLSVIDTNAPSGPNYYRVNTLEDSPARLPKSIRSKWLQLNNVYGLPKNSIRDCQRNTLQVNFDPARQDQSSSVVLMLVPE